jgi:DNA polymerase III alpha subunit
MDSEEGAAFKAEFEKLTVPFEGEQISVKDTCLTLEGLRRHGGVHAAGVVVADRPLIELAPLYKKTKDAEVQIQYDMRDAETVGLLKMDVLGLRTVSVLGEAEALIRRNDPRLLDQCVPLDDAKTFALLSVEILAQYSNSRGMVLLRLAPGCGPIGLKTSSH